MSATRILHDPVFQPSRRKFLKRTGGLAGTFLLGAYVSFPHSFSAEGQAPEGIYDPNIFLRINPDSSVVIISKHLEMGQGVTTGLATMIAEELNADWSKVQFEFAANNTKLYNNLLFGPVQGTGGSSSMAESWTQMRKVGAATRAMFISAAAAKWNVPAAGIKVEKGIVIHSESGKKAQFGELASDAMRVPVPTNVTLKAERDWTLIGTVTPRIDNVQKTTGTGIFAMDLRRPGMLTAVVKRPDRFGATTVSFDATEARKIDGVVDVIQIPRGVAVLATDTWAAIQGREALKISWDNSKAEMRSTPAIMREYADLAKGTGLPADKRGDAAAALAKAAKTHQAEFTFPYLAHAPMEPLNCTLEWHGDHAEYWAGSQLQSLDDHIIAGVLGIQPEQVKINTLLAGGSFGRRGNPLGDWTLEVAQIVKAIGGRAPVHLVWTREDDIKGGAYRPMFLHKVNVGLDASGQISGWQHKIVGQPIFIGTPFEPMGVKEGVDNGTVEGVIHTPYAIQDFSVEAFNAKSPVTVTWFRSVGHTHSAHAMETTMDELAHLAKKDPVEFRLALLKELPRDSAVIRLAAEKAGWNRSMPKGTGLGFAYQYSFNTRVAMVTEVSHHPETPMEPIRVKRVVAAVDCGVAINPDVIAAQIQGSIGFALCVPLRSQITFKDGLVEQSNLDDYEPTRLREMPKVEVHIMKSAELPTGVGEPGVPPLAPSIGNAIFAATGKRLRNLPFDLQSLA
jgi:isoquinoline 1-oxidoreductase subunit beta